MNQKLPKYCRKSILKLIILVLFVTSFKSYSQQKNFYFNHFTVEDGLSQNSINSIVQDENGFIWLATESGLNRFDGYSFKNWFEDPKNKNSLTSGFINELVVDHSNRIWLATLSGINCFVPEQEKFYSISFNLVNNKDDIDNATSCIFIDSENYLWAGTKNGLNCSSIALSDLNLNDSNLIFSNYCSVNSLNSISNDEVTCVTEDKNGDIWIGTANGLNKYNKQSRKFDIFYFDQYVNEQKGANHINDIVQINDSIIWIGTDVGLFNLNIKSKESFSFNDHPFFIRRNITGRIKSLLLDREANIWVGTLGNGLLNYNSSENKFYQYKKEDKKNNGLIENYIYTLFEDLSGTLFIGNYSNGFHTAKNSGGVFESFGNISNDPENSYNNFILDAYCNDTNAVWITTLSEGVVKFNPQTKRFNHIFGNKLKSNKELHGIASAFPEKDNNVWIVTKNKGLVLYNVSIDRYEQYFDNGSIYCLETSQDSNFWIGTLEAELFKFNTLTREKKEFYLVNADSIPFEYGFTFIKPDANDMLWIATWGGGLLKFDPKSGVTESFVHSKQKRNSISSDFLLYIHIDKEGILWFGTTAGLNKFNPQKKEFTYFGKKNGLNDEFINSIEEDEHKNLWFSTNRGISKFNKTTETTINFDEKDGLQDKEFNSACNTKLSDGRMIFGGIRGFNLFHPDSIKLSTFEPKMAITEFQLYHNEVEIGLEYDNNFILSKSIVETDTITLDYKNNVIGFKFSAFDFTNPNNIQYAFRLKGFEENWNYTDNTERFARYTNLKYGNYLLQIKSTNGDGVWNRNIKELSVIIKAPFWMTNEFLVAISVLIFLIFVLIYRIRTRILQKQKEKLEQQVDERTKEVRHKNFQLKDRYEEIVVQEEEIREQAEELRVISEELEKTNKTLSIKVKERTKDLASALNKAKDAQNLISAFLSNLSHEIRTPMNAIIGFSQLISSGVLSETKKEEYGTIVEQNVQSLLTQIDNIMDVAKLHSGQYQFKNSLFELNDTFLEIYDELALNSKVSSKIISLNFEVDENLMINSDPIVFKNIIFNLVENAIKYTEQGVVEFGFKTNRTNNKNKNYTVNENSSTELVIFVNDTGIGIAKKDQKTVFDAFRKIEDNKQKLYRGSGLGLALVKHLTDMLKGEVILDSKVDEGTKILIKIPVSEI